MLLAISIDPSIDQLFTCFRPTVRFRFSEISGGLSSGNEFCRLVLRGIVKVFVISPSVACPLSLRPSKLEKPSFLRRQITARRWHLAASWERFQFRSFETPERTRPRAGRPRRAACFPACTAAGSRPSLAAPAASSWAQTETRIYINIKNVDIVAVYRFNVIKFVVFHFRNKIITIMTMPLYTYHRWLDILCNSLYCNLILTNVDFCKG